MQCIDIKGFLWKIKSYDFEYDPYLIPQMA